jgi:[NiFe] hydrogenase assembly HybE family chaperone
MYAENPAPLLEETFRDIHATRMAGLSVLNPALAVEAVGFAAHAQGWLGVLITPWFMSLLYLPRAGAPWQPLPLGEKRRLAFPAGEIEFTGGFEERLGDYQSCSLFSPMGAFDDQATAREAALAALATLTTPPVPEPEAAPGAPASPAKRAFLRGVKNLLG